MTSEGDWKHSATLALTLPLYEVGWSTPHPTRFTPGNDPIPIVHEAGWAPGPDLTFAEEFAPTGIRSPSLQPVVNRYTD